MNSFMLQPEEDKNHRGEAFRLSESALGMNRQSQ
jgi:hypothetical protein